MLTDAEKQAIDKMAATMPLREAASIEALKVVQRRKGWVDDESFADAADYLGMTTHELDSVATFYNLIFRQPVGRHVILLCDSVSCWVVGYEKIRDALKERLGIDFGQTTGDQRFTLLPMVCLGACDRAPVLMIDEDLHGDVTADTIEEVLARYE